MANCDEHTNTEDHVLVKMTFKVQIEDILAFEALVLKKELYKNGAVNFHSVILLCNYFGTPLHLSKELLPVLLNAETTFTHGISTITAYQLTKKLQDHVNLSSLFETSISLKDRLKYMRNHHRQDIIFNPRFIPQLQVSQTLCIELEILQCLSDSTCVIAGGAALKLGCPDTPFTERCDVDIFVLNGPAQKETVLHLLHVLQETGRHILHQGKSVFSAIGAYGVRRIQIIASECKTPQELVSGFDFTALCAYYSGHLLHATVGAQYAWTTRKCRISIDGNHVIPLRLFSMFWKGFQLTELAIQFLRDTIGFPPRKELLDDFLYAVPFISRDIDLKVQYALLHRLHQFVLVNLNEELEIECLSIKRYGSIAPVIYKGELEDYAKTCPVHYRPPPQDSKRSYNAKLRHPIRSISSIKRNVTYL